jgi:hypothetical protein
MLVQTADSVAVEPFFLDLEVRSDQKLRRQLLDRKSNGFRGFGKAPVTHRPISLAATGREQLGRRVIVKFAAGSRFRHCVRSDLLHAPSRQMPVFQRRWLETYIIPANSFELTKSWYQDRSSIVTAMRLFFARIALASAAMARPRGSTRRGEISTIDESVAAPLAHLFGGACERLQTYRAFKAKLLPPIHGRPGLVVARISAALPKHGFDLALPKVNPRKPNAVRPVGLQMV